MAEEEACPELELLMDAAWPAAERHEAGAWVLRAASGVTQRANSVWPRWETDSTWSALSIPGTGTGQDRLASLREARLWYRSRRLPLIFQVFDGPRHAALNAVLDDEGFTRQSETVILQRRGTAAPPADSGVHILDEPSDEWLGLWWGVDGRGGDTEMGVARGILTGCPSLYALVRDDDGMPAAVGRLALAGRQGGLYCMATRQDARRRGYATRVLHSLLAAGAARGLTRYWLLVMASNTGARGLYREAGFQEAGRYLYRQERPRRHLTGC